MSGEIDFERRISSKFKGMKEIDHPHPQRAQSIDLGQPPVYFHSIPGRR